MTDAARSATTVTLDDVLAAREGLRGVIEPTPLEFSQALTDLVGAPVRVKCENLQKAGSFKIRGAFTRMSALTADERARGVVAASAGNHAQGVALAARILGIQATIFMPKGAPMPKLSATRGYGARVELVGTTVDDCIARSLEFEAQTGAVFIPPFDHPAIVAGQGTCGLEILEQCPDVRTVLVCTGGGGLLAGIALAIKTQRPDVRVIGVQAEQAAAWPGSLSAGHPVPLDRMSTMADGIAVGRPGDVPFDIVRRLVDDIVTVSEDSIARALLFAIERAKLVVEPAGAAALAHVLELSGSQPRPEGQQPLLEGPVVTVLSGGNVDPLLLLRVIRSGMTVAGRYLQFTVRVPDRPGSLARLLAQLADLEANVHEVQHGRTSASLGVHEVQIGLTVETEGPEHSARVRQALQDEGYPLQMR